MNKPLLCGLFGILVGAGAMRLIDSRYSAGRATSSPELPGQVAQFGGEPDPVVTALDTGAFLEKITGNKFTLTGFKSGYGGSDDYRHGEAVWEAQPLDENALRERVVAALKNMIAAGGGTSLSSFDGVMDADVLVAALETDSHKLYSFACTYRVKIGDRLQQRRATVWVTTPLRGTQHSACFRIGK